MLISVGIGILVFSSCKKQETVVSFTGGTAPILSQFKDTVPLHAADSGLRAIDVSWTNPNYQFSNGTSSLNVSYYVEFDTVGANFTSPNMVQIQINNNLDTAFNEYSLNALVTNKLGLADSVPHHIQVRVIAFVTGYQNAANNLVMTSNLSSFVCTPYNPPKPPPTIVPPTTNTLFIIGTAVASGWSNPIPVPGPQQFTQVSSTEYTIKVTLTGAMEYKFIAKNGSWGENWGIPTADDPAEINGGKFTSNSGNIKSPATTGDYDIDVNFQTGKFTVTPH